MNNVRSCNLRGIRGGNYVGSYPTFTPGGLPSGTTQFASRMECFTALYKGMVKYSTSNNAQFNPNVNYASDFNSWLMASGHVYATATDKTWSPITLRDIHFEHIKLLRWSTNEGYVEIRMSGNGASKKQAINRTCKLVWDYIRDNVPKVQMYRTSESNQDDALDIDSHVRRMYLRHGKTPRIQMEQPEKTTEQGDVTQQSVKESNTIITRDQQESVAEPHKALDTTTPIVSTEPVHNFKHITDRWMPLTNLSVTTTNKYNDIITSLYLPEAIYGANCSPNLIPFETFIYGRMSIELRLVVNANKFSCGKIVMSSKYDTYQADEICSLTQSALARNHVIIDLCTNNEGVLNIPFRFHRPMMRLVASDNASGGVRSGKYASAYIHVLSPLQTGPDGPTDVGLTIFYRLRGAEFGGMTYRAKVQMLGIENVITPKTASALKEVLAGAERAFDQLGKSDNQDKPGIIGAMPVIPRPRLNFATGKGTIDVVPLRINPHTLTNYQHISVPNDEPKSFYDLARIWGIYKTFEWNKTAKVGDVLGSLIVDPCSRNYSTDYDGEPTPLEYATDNFAFWSGPVELRFDFVSNAYHTGTIQISAEFGRTTSSTDACESQSTYTKTFHLGDQKTVSFVVPYIYDTVMRRTTSVMNNPYQAMEASDAISKLGLTIAPLSRTVVKVRVINALRPIASAPQKIEVLVFMRAGKEFTFHGLKGFSMLHKNSDNVLDNFPEKYEVASARKKRDTASDTQAEEARITALVKSGRLVPPSKANRWNEYLPQYLPQIQMDNGNKENQDQTDDFAQGPSRSTVNTLDHHGNFKDLLRKPVLLAWNTRIQASKGTKAWYLPLMPPSRALCAGDASIVATRIFAPTLSSTSTVAIMDMFRAWRGSMRYTIVCNNPNSAPFYVSLLPHSGVRIVGNHSQLVTESTLDWPMAGTNMITELVVPSVNPTITIEVPYDTENTWTLTWDVDPCRSYSWRDKGDYNTGHIVITSHYDVNCDIWWSAGDDFTVANFYGIPSVKINSQAYRLADAPSVQMDFCPRETATKVTGLIKSVCTTRNIGRAALASVPVIGMPLLAADTVNRTLDIAEQTQTSINTTMGKATESLSKIDQLVEGLGETNATITDLITQAVTQVTQKLGNLVSAGVILYDVLLDILMAWMEKSWRIVGIAVVRFVSKIFIFDHSRWPNLLPYVEQLGYWLSSMVTDSAPRVQIDTTTSTLVGIMCGIVGTITGVYMEPWHSDRFSMFASLGRRLTTSTGISYLLGVLRFVQNIFEVVKETVLRMLGYVSPEAMALRMLSDSNEEIRKFVVEAQMMTCEANMMMLNSPTYRRRFWFTVLQAHKIQRLVCQIPNNVASNQLTALCTKVIKCGDERFMDLSACPVRFEPMVICVEGKPGIGKSFMTEKLVHKLLAKVNVVPYSTEAIYYRTSGEKFWSGYRNQPVVVYDEWLNTTDATRCTDQVLEMMKLKSTAIFVPEMAHLDEKKMRANPLLVIIMCNDAFPNNLGDYARDVPANLRRRDAVIRMKMKTEFEGINFRQLTENDRLAVANYEHVEFQKFDDVTNPRSLNPSVKSYGAMEEWLCQQWANYHRTEIVNVNTRMNRLPQYVASAAEFGNLRDPFTIFYQVNHEIMNDDVSQNAWTPYEQLEQAVTLVSAAMRIPEPREEPAAELISWEEVEAPAVQLEWGEITAGLLWTGTIPAMIARATKRQIAAWSDYIMGRREETGFCYVCRQEGVQCVSVCRQTSRNTTPSARHMLCATCHVSNHRYGRGMCGLCRCPDIEWIVTQADMNRISVWARASLWLGRGVTWFCDKLIAYYNYRQEHITDLIFVDIVIGILHTVYKNIETCGPPESSYIGLIPALDRYAHIGFRLCQMWGAEIFASPEVQGDDWDVTPTTSTRVTPRDMFNTIISREAVEDLLLHSEPHMFCTHDLLDRNIGSVKLTPTHWQVPDATGVLIQVPLTLCEDNCHFTDVDTYLALFTRYAHYMRSNIRQLYITLYNNPTDVNFNNIPKVFQPTWYRNLTPPVGQTWWEWLGEAWVQYKQAIMYTIGAITAVGIVVKLYDFATSITNSSTIQASGTVDSPGLSPRHSRRLVERARGNRTYFQSTPDTPDILDVVMGYVARNTFQLILSKAGKEQVMYGTGLFNSYLLIPRHYAREIRAKIMDGATLYGFPLSSPQLRAEITINKETFVEDKDNDIAYMQLPTKYPLFKDIRKFLALDEDFDNPLPARGILLGNPKCGSQYMREIDVDIFGLRDEQVILDQNDQSFTVKDVVLYGFSRPGSCGSLLLRENHQRPILSMHFAGTGEGVTGEGYGVPLTREGLASLCAITNVAVQFDDVEYGPIENMSMDFGMDTFLTYYGSVPPEKVPYIPTKSKLVKSAIHGAEELKVDIEPAILDRKDPRYIHESTPLYEGVKKHGKPTIDFDEALVEQAGEAYWDLWLQQMKPVVADPKILTDEQAIIGLDFPYYTPMDLSTSAGYPYSLDKQNTLKSAYIEVVRDPQLKVIGVSKLDQKLVDILNFKRAKRSQGIVPHTLFIDTLKDEKRPSKKARSLGGTRVFCSSPMDYVIDCRKWFLHFTAAFMEQRMNLMHAVGIDPTSEEWSRLTNNLLKKNGKFCTIDYTNFGAGFNASVAKKAYQLMIRWVTENVKGTSEHEQVMWCLVYECLQSMHVCNNVVYQQGTGSPSGAFFTTIINTMVNHLYLLIAWRALVLPTMSMTFNVCYTEFKKNVCLYCYGDDGIFTVKDEYLGVYNMKTITEFFSLYGIVATGAEKDKEIVPYQTLSEASFLKRGFKIHPTRTGQWLSPLKLESVHSTTQWVWKSPNLNDATFVNAEAAMLQVHGHGKAVFDRFRNVVNKYLVKAKCRPISMDWSEIDNKFYTIGLEFNVEEFLYKNMY